MRLATADAQTPTWSSWWTTNSSNGSHGHKEAACDPDGLRSVVRRTFLEDVESDDGWR